MIKSIIARFIYYPLYNLIYKRNGEDYYYKQFKKAQWKDFEDNKKKQAEKLYELINYASKNVKYYKNIIRRNKITFSKKTIFKDMKKLPILTKDKIRNNFEEICTIPDNSSYRINKSGGSTGEPITIIQDNRYDAETRAMTKLQYDWCGNVFGEPKVTLWGSDKDISLINEKFKHRFSNWINSNNILNSFTLDEKNMKNYVDKINSIKPKFILAYVDSIYQLSEFIEQNDLSIWSPKSIMTSAGVLSSYKRKKIEKVFKSEVFNRYGSREVGNIASECKFHKGLHLSTFTHYVEILNNKLQPCRDGESGDIYITLLNNFTMPLIRYKIGDIGTYTKNICPCGRGLPLIKKIIGRDTDFIISRNKNRLQGEFILYLISIKFNNQSISKFQVVQDKLDKISIMVVIRNKKEFNKIKNKIEREINRAMGEKITIIWKSVKEIYPTSSGKFRFIINNIERKILEN